MAPQLTLVVMAAGMGSRFGGLKQVEPVGPNGETLLDYSIHDAIRAGFERVFFVIRRDIEAVFRKQVGAKYDDKLEVGYVFQELDCLPEGFRPPPMRTKPWGTGHAVQVASQEVDHPLAVINADDFYGGEAFQLLSDYLRQAKPHHHVLVAYELKNTLSDHGSVSRGVCRLDTTQNLVGIEEITNLKRGNDGRITGTRPDGQQAEFTGDEPVSMNLWGFTPDIRELLDDAFREFMEENADSEKAEFHLPKAIDDGLKSERISARVLCTGEHWFGVTYREDRERVAEAIAGLVTADRYPSPLFP